MYCICHNRRGNWITLKMRKLIKSKKDANRERLKSVTLTPTRSESSEGFLQLPHQDSQDSSSVGSNSLEDGQTLGTKKSSSEYYKTSFSFNDPCLSDYKLRDAGRSYMFGGFLKIFFFKSLRIELGFIYTDFLKVLEWTGASFLHFSSSELSVLKCIYGAGTQ